MCPVLDNQWDSSAGGSLPLRTGTAQRLPTTIDVGVVGAVGPLQNRRICEGVFARARPQRELIVGTRKKWFPASHPRGPSRNCSRWTLRLSTDWQH
jgi:hypothetical protein